MPILRVNAGLDGLSIHGSPAPALAAAGHAAKGTGPVIVMVHGFKYDPTSPDRNPHKTIFSCNSGRDSERHVSWPRHLGFGGAVPGEGLAIAFGWKARGNLWCAEKAARAAGHQLARLIGRIKERAPDRPVHFVTHSMGSEVAFAALHRLPQRTVHRIVALSAASYASTAWAALETRAGRSAELFNITSRENDVFDFVYERLMASPRRGDWTLGKGLNLPNVVNIQLDCPETLAALRGFGGQIAAPQKRVCHWSGYVRPGALHFYAHVLRNPESVSLESLRNTLPVAHARRWSRLLSLPTSAGPLPVARKIA